MPVDGLPADSSRRLFEPVRVGAVDLPNRIVMAPLGRARAHVETRQPTASVAVYYAQRATAGLIVSEATHVSAESVSRPGTSAIHDDAHVDAWSRVTRAVHDAGGRMFQQLFHLGRKADPARLPGGGLPAGPSPIAAKGQFTTPAGPQPFPVPRALDVDEIAERVSEFARAARNSRRAGFDGIELHGANGFLIDQFLRDSANRRDDRYGGSIENRARFLLEILDAVGTAVGFDRVGVRVSPHARVDGTDDSNPGALFEYVASRLEERRVAYLHLIEPVDTPAADRLAPRLRRAFRGPLIVCGGLDRASASELLAEGDADLVAFGTAYIANPDLVERLRIAAPWNPPDPSTFYSGGDRGYIDYPFLTPGGRQYHERDRRWTLDSPASARS
jgi:N-ethylmaleimide reductase